MLGCLGGGWVQVDVGKVKLGLGTFGCGGRQGQAMLGICGGWAGAGGVGVGYRWMLVGCVEA